MARASKRAEKVIKFIETYCRVPEGKHVGKPMKLEPFQKKFIAAVYTADKRVRRAYLSIARKNGKTGFCAAILLAHIVGPEAVLNSQIISGARSRDQAALVFNLAVKMINLNPDLESRCRIIPSGKKIIGLALNVEFRAVSAEAGTAHGLSPVLAILDEVGQVRGDHDPFIEAVETAQGAYDEPLLIAISTQAATDADLFSMWLDDAKSSKDPAIVSHLYTAPEDCDIMDRKAWYAANPALGKFRSLPQLEREMEQASRLPSKENSARWLYLNQRIEASSPFISRKLWQECFSEETCDFRGKPVYGGLDLSEVADLTACVLIAQDEGKWYTKPTFWLPGEGLREKSIRERVPYDRWAAANFLQTTPGRSIEYEYVAAWLRHLFNEYDVRQMAFDRWNYRHLRPWLEKAGFSPEEMERFVEFGQGYASMSPALRDLESLVLNGKLQHDGHPVLTMCAANAVVQTDPAGNKKLVKNKSAGRIDGMVALAMACSVAATEEIEETGSYLDDGAEMVIL